MFAVLLMQCIYIYILQDGCTALHLAVRGGHQEVVELFLEANADPEPKTKVISLLKYGYTM